MGLTKDGEYKYFDYSDYHEVDPSDLSFYDSFAPLLIDYLTAEPDTSFEEYLKNTGITVGEDIENPRLIYKKVRIAWTKWNNRLKRGDS